MQTALPCELQELFDALQDLRFSLLIEAADRGDGHAYRVQPLSVTDASICRVCRWDTCCGGAASEH